MWNWNWIVGETMTRHKPNKYLPKGDGTPGEQEKTIADRLGGKRVAGSGASIYSKGDVRDVDASGSDENIEFLLECKQTKHASLRVKWEWLTKITREANAVQKEPALVMEIQGGKMDPLCDRQWIAVPVRVFERLVNID